MGPCCLNWNMGRSATPDRCLVKAATNWVKWVSRKEELSPVRDLTALVHRCWLYRATRFACTSLLREQVLRGVFLAFWEESMKFVHRLQGDRTQVRIPAATG